MGLSRPTAGSEPVSDSAQAPREGWKRGCGLCDHLAGVVQARVALRNNEKPGAWPGSGLNGWA